jgi:sensor domain CHASE-containing protein
MSDTRRYLVNPEVSCREEGPDGALLFNPDTDAILVINPTGLLIWQALDQSRTRDEIVAHLLEVCEDVPTDQVAEDVDEFIQRLQPGGFIGEVLENDVR